jgi:hypothetical protein
MLNEISLSTTMLTASEGLRAVLVLCCTLLDATVAPTDGAGRGCAGALVVPFDPAALAVACVVLVTASTRWRVADLARRNSLEAATVGLGALCDTNRKSEVFCYRIKNQINRVYALKGSKILATHQLISIITMCTRKHTASNVCL